MNSHDAQSEPIPVLEGVVFSPEEHAGFWRRVVATFVDLVVLFLLYVTLFNVWLLMRGSPWFTGSTFLPAATVVVGLYLGPLKRSRLRTVGYRIAGVRIVNLRGTRPSLMMMTLRAACYLNGAVAFALIDLAWLQWHRPRRKLSDFISETYVVRVRARPMAPAKIVTVYYAFGGHFWIFREVHTRSQITALSQ